MEITLINRTNQDVSVYASLFQKIAKSAEKILDLPEDYELSVTFVRSQTIHKINRDYRNVDRPTDVISFAKRKKISVIFLLISITARSRQKNMVIPMTEKWDSCLHMECCTV